MKTGILFTLFLSIVKHSSSARVDSDGGYANVVVSLSSNLNYSQDLVSKIQDFFSQANHRLYAATYNRVFIKSVVYVAPNSWPIANESSEFHRADIRIDHANNLFPEQAIPHTQQPRGCGQRGNFIYLTTEVIDKWVKANDSQQVIQFKFVQEWAKFRYGVFEETGSKTSTTFPDAYTDAHGERTKTGCASPNPWIPTKCTTCGEFELDPRSLPVHLSVMDDTPLKPKVFCTHFHNSLAPTRQNMLCGRKSTWHVVTESSDFANLSTDHNNNTLNSLMPTYTIVKLRPSIFIILVDPDLCPTQSVSNTKNTLVWFAIMQFIAMLPEDAQIGFVMASATLEDIPISTRKDFIARKDHLRTMIFPNAPSTKDWTKGLNLTMRMRESSGHPSHLVLLADGVNPDFPRPKIEDELRNNFITLFLLTFTPVKSTVSSLTFETMKMFLDYPNSLWYNIPILDTRIDTWNQAQRHLINDAFTVYFNRFAIQEFEPKDFKINTVMGGERTFRIPPNDEVNEFRTFCDSSLKTATLTVKGIDYSNFDIDSETIILTFHWPAENSTVQFQVGNGTNCSETTLWSLKNPTLFSGQIDKPKGVNLPYVLYGFCTKSWSISADITLPSGGTHNMELRDNGNGDPDVRSGDGIFSRYLIYPNMQPGMHTIWLLANDDTRGIILRTYVGTYFLPSIDLTLVPPNLIGDFHLTQINAANGLAEFQWTAPGRNCDHNAAHSYYLNCPTDLSNSSDLASGIKLTMTPKESGQRETFKWAIPSANVPYYCRIRAKNEHIPNEISMIMLVYLKKNQISTTASSETSPAANHNTATSTSVATSELQKECPEIPIGLIVGGIVGEIVIIAILNVVAWYLIYKRLGRLSKRCKTNIELNQTAQSAQINREEVPQNQYNGTPKAQPATVASRLAEILKEGTRDPTQNPSFATTQVSDAPIYDDVAEPIYDVIDPDEIGNDKSDNGFYDDVHV